MKKEVLEIQYINGNECQLEAGEESKAIERAKKDIKHFMETEYPAKRYEIANIDNYEFFAVNTISMEILSPSVTITPLLADEES